MKKLLLPLSFLLILLTSCGTKEDDKVKPDPDPTAPIKGCHLTKMSVPGFGEVNYTYNAAGYVTKRDISMQGSGPSEMHEYIYNAQNQLITVKFFDDGQLEYQKDLEYSNNLLTKIITSENGSIREEQLTYDGNQRLKESKLIDPIYDFKSLYEYDAKGNVLRIASYSDNQLTYESTFSNYDDKPGMYATLTGLNIPDDAHDMDGLGKLMKNNPGKVKHVFFSQQSNGTIQQIVDADDTYTYTYGEDGLPLTMTIQNMSGNSQTINLSYKCN